ncbi:hypothetical protein [Tumidithrix helvetica]
MGLDRAIALETHDSSVAFKMTGGILRSTDSVSAIAACFNLKLSGYART